MSSVHISLDMQLYMVEVLVKSSDPERWRAVISHPGCMHNVMSFIRCIDNLMKGSGLKELLGAAYCGLEGIFSGKGHSRASVAHVHWLPILIVDGR